MDSCTAKPEDMECSICTDVITAETGQVKLACSHVFHLGCIGRWTIRGATNCPLCRTNLTEKEMIDNEPAPVLDRSFLSPLEYLARYLNITTGQAQIYVDSFGGDHEAVIRYVHYVRRHQNEAFYIPPLEHIHRPPVIPDRNYFEAEEFGRKRYWLRFRRNVEHYLDRGYDTE